MIQIRPVSDLRNKFSEIEEIVKEGSPVYLTKNGYGSMVVLSLEEYSRLSEYDRYVERKLDEAETEAESSGARLSHEEVFGHARSILNGK